MIDQTSGHPHWVSGIIYVTTNLVNGKIYVGLHTRNLRGYLGSGVYITNAIKKYGKNCFRRDTVDEFDDIEVGLAKERYWISKLQSKHPRGYNITDGGKGVFGHKQSLESRLKMSASKKKLYKEHPELKKKMGLANIGRPCWSKGKKMSREYREKLSASHLGHKDSEETKQKKSISAKKAWAIRKYSQGGVLLSTQPN